MGSVAMGTGGSYRFDGYTYSSTAYCLYCDKCGSFNIGKRITPNILIWISVVAIIATLAWNYAKESSLPNALLVCSTSLLISMSLMVSFVSSYTESRCRKCGNKHITNGNVLNYPENNRSILDVPNENTVKYYIDDH